MSSEGEKESEGEKDSIYYRLFKCLKCGKERILNAIGGYYLVFFCDDVENYGGKVKWLDLEAKEMHRIGRNVAVFCLFLALKSSGVGILASTSIPEFDMEVMTILDAMLKFEIYKRDEPEAYTMIAVDSKIGEKSRERLLAGAKPFELKRMQLTMEVKETTRIGFCPCCDGIATVKVDNYMVHLFMKNAKDLNKDFDEKYVSELNRLSRFFVGYEVLVRIMEYGLCAMNHDEEVRYVLSLISALVNVHIFELMANGNKSAYMVFRDDVYKAKKDTDVFQNLVKLDLKKEFMKEMGMNKEHFNNLYS